MEQAPKQLDIFHNTTRLEGSVFNEKRRNAHAQMMQVLQVFRERPDQLLTSFDVLKILGWNIVKLNSVRRAMTGLAQADPPLLVKTDMMRLEELGSPNHCWKLYR